MVPVVDVWIGQSISGYNIEARIGSGAFGKIYKAAKPGEAPVAVKVLHSAQSGFFESEIYRELSSHRHFPKWHLFHSFDSYHFIVVSLAYKDLAHLQILNRPREFSPTTVQVIGRQLISAFGFLHFKMICHGDIKPANLLVAPPKGRENITRIWICDFGLATRYEKKGVRMLGTSFEYTEYSLSSPFIPKNGTPKDRDDVVQMSFCLLSLSGHNLQELEGEIEDGNNWKRKIISEPASTLDPEFSFLFNFLVTVGKQTDDVVNYEALTQSIAGMIEGSSGNQDLILTNKGDGTYRLY